MTPVTMPDPGKPPWTQTCSSTPSASMLLSPSGLPARRCVWAFTGFQSVMSPVPELVGQGRGRAGHGGEQHAVSWPITMTPRFRQTAASWPASTAKTGSQQVLSTEDVDAPNSGQGINQPAQGRTAPRAAGSVIHVGGLAIGFAYRQHPTRP